MFLSKPMKKKRTKTLSVKKPPQAEMSKRLPLVNKEPTRWVHFKRNAWGFISIEMIPWLKMMINFLCPTWMSTALGLFISFCVSRFFSSRLFLSFSFSGSGWSGDGGESVKMLLWSGPWFRSTFEIYLADTTAWNRVMADPAGHLSTRSYWLSGSSSFFLTSSPSPPLVAFNCPFFSHWLHCVPRFASWSSYFLSSLLVLTKFYRVLLGFLLGLSGSCYGPAWGSSFNWWLLVKW